jgi:hypothetical protein
VSKPETIPPSPVESDFSPQARDLVAALCFKSRWAFLDQSGRRVVLVRCAELAEAFKQ